MSAFCVFGVSREACHKRAEEEVSFSDFNPVTGVKRTLSIAEWRGRVEDMGNDLFASGMVRRKQISPAFDTPHFAQDWIDTGLRTGAIREPKIMARGVKVDKHGDEVINKKTGNKVITWVPYEG